MIGASSQLFGSITIKRDAKYKRFAKTGRFAAGKQLREFSGGSVVGYSIRFRRGPLNRFKGYWFTSTTGTHEIALARPGSDFVNIYCDD